jgi:hypothetical protein
MSVPFTHAEFIGVFVAYNSAIWPLQVVATLLGLVAVTLLLVRSPNADRGIAATLAVFWLSMGAGYHWAFFSAINPAAYFFGALFVAEGLILVVDGAIRGRISFHGAPTVRVMLAAVLIAYAFVVYPLIGLCVTHRYPETPLFGVAPCPTTIFTLACLMLGGHRPSLVVSSIPVVWAVIGGSAAVILDVRQDWGLIAALIVWGLAFYVGPERRSPTRPG